ncbi:MAG: hypothetical protein QNL02_00220 [Paracoccaceae bacterium]|jgi:ABC transporter substrate binding protein (PQQ-dependent alcohol dehydrogenase system)|tara:strand:- start:2468 stop:3721 length:1254 start_codon:yes stop_codon:yes gene_type:complete
MAFWFLSEMRYIPLLKLCVLGLIGLFLRSADPVLAAAEQKLEIPVFWLHLNIDPEWQEQRAYTGLALKQRYPALRGITIGLLENKIKLRAKEAIFAFSEITAMDAADGIAKVMAAVPAGAAVLLDLPEADMHRVIVGLAGQDIALFNIRSKAMNLRETACQGNTFHILPSRRMYADTVAQFLALRNWRRALLLVGRHNNDIADAAALEASFQKFQVEVVDRRTFSLSNNPRDRDMNNLKLLTGGIEYDVVVIADDVGEYSRYVPYNTFLPRPVIGGSGLVARAWHWSWERFGAPQLNQRFDRRAKKAGISDHKTRQMNDVDWAAWAAIKLIATSVPAASVGSEVNLLQALLDQELAVDLYKGSRGSLRQWNHQLRQPMLIATHDAVIEKLPGVKFLHQHFYEDTLGIDVHQTGCQFN